MKETEDNAERNQQKKAHVHTDVSEIFPIMNEELSVCIKKAHFIPTKTILY